MDPTSLAVVTSAITLLGQEVTKGVALEAGKSLWATIHQKLFPQRNTPPNTEELAVLVAQQLQQNPALLQEIATLLMAAPSTTAGKMVQHANSITNIGTQHIEGDFNLNM